MQEIKNSSCQEKVTVVFLSKISIKKRKNIDIFITKYYLDISNNSYY